MRKNILKMIIVILFITLWAYFKLTATETVIVSTNEPNKKPIRITQVDTIEIFENNFDSTWEVYGCRYYGYKQQDNENRN